MTPILLYLLKANVVLLLFVAAYYGLLRRLTFFTLNRAYLLLALVFAAVYPALPMPALLPAEAVAPVALVVLDTADAGTAAAPVPAVPLMDWAALALAVYGAGTAVLLVRLLVQLLSLRRLRRQSHPAVVEGQPVRVLPGPVSPFSFGRSIYLNPAQHPTSELAAVLRHELVHVRQWHTIDVLLAQLGQAAAWCNPAAWLLRRALLDNLEYLADQAVLATGLVDRRAYQYSLLRLSHTAPGPSLVSHFTFLTLKNRVVMMNLPLSSSGKLARYFVAGPLVMAVALGILGARAQSAGPVVVAKATPLATEGFNSIAHGALQREPGAPAPVFYVDGQRQNGDINHIKNEDIANMTLLKGAAARQLLGQEARRGVAVVTTKANQNRPDVVAFNKKITAANTRITSAKTTTAAGPAEHQLPDGIKAYIAKTYPESKLVGWAIVDESVDKTVKVKYFASIVERSGEKRKLFFDANQQPVAAPERQEKANSLALAQTPKYVDGQLFTGDFDAIDPKTIASINVYKGDKARHFFGETGGKGVIVITTKANENRADVVTFNERLTAQPAALAQAPTAAPAQAAPVAYLAAPALAYITQHYPDARLLEVKALPTTDGGAPRYQAQIVIGRRPGYLLFDGQGQFISESYTSYSK